MKKFAKEFKEFISRGSVMDMAVGIIIGTAFTAIITSLVNDIIMPLISLIFGGTNFDKWNIVIGSGDDASTIAIGTFIAAVINFILIALVVFIMIKAINKVHKKKETEEAPTTKECIFCHTEIPIAACKCPNCTADLPAEEKA